MTVDGVLREKLKKVYWLGGMSCSEKTTIASVLFERYRLPVHHRDDAVASHSERTTPDRHPTMCKWRDVLQTKAMYEQLQRPIDELIDEISESAQEDFDMTREDFSDMSFEDATLIEGARLWPKLVNEILADRSHAVWLLPTTQMYQEVLAKREGMTQFWQIQKFSRPEEGFSRLVAVYHGVAERIALNARETGLSVIEVRDIADLSRAADKITYCFRLEKPA